ncbi:hypothetical protein C2845_PM01G11110 [Panicum miliaceum]|uniref:Zinc finger PHD-type domain-containing protein n=1 Tax=Panicum miliaceum TaxID=4540 RepID=A0A3L6TKG1_PANMI|nr:hypothetical protein C2845_PM01G11110 [Panicum miliaceum]
MQQPEECASTAAGEYINSVRDLLPFLLHVPVTYRFAKKDAWLEGFVTDGGYTCACPASSSCGYRGKVLSALQFEKHAGAESKNQNGHIFLSNGKSLYALFQELRDVPAEALAEKFEAAAGVPMTMAAAEASPAPQGPRQGHQPGAPASWEPNGVQVDGATAEPPSLPAPACGDVDRLTEEEKASLCLLGLRESCSTIQSAPMDGIEGPATEQIEDEAGGDCAIPDVKVRTGAGFMVTYKKDEVEKIGRIRGQGYSCGCSECNYSRSVMNASSFQKRKDYSDDVASDGCSTQGSRELAVGEMIYSLTRIKESASSSVLNLNWSASIRRSERRGGSETSTPALSRSQDKGVSGLSTGTSKKNGTEDTHSENTAGPLSVDDVKPDSPEPTAIIPDCSNHDPTYLGLSLSSPVTIAQEPLPNSNIDSKDTTLHPLIFKEGGLPDNTLLTYKLKNGEFTPSHFEEHAGMGRRRQPYHNIYTSDGVTLHKLALQLQDRLNSNGFGTANVSSFSDYPNLTSSGCGREPTTTSRPIIPLKRTLQERVVETERCSFCGDGHTTLGNIDPDTIVFCNQCERPCHIKCYDTGLEKKKVPLEILKEYMHFCFLCCEICRLLRARLDGGLEKCEEIAFLRRIRSNICWRLLSGMNARSDLQLYMPQVIDILKDAFAETAEHSAYHLIRKHRDKYLLGDAGAGPLGGRAARWRVRRWGSRGVERRLEADDGVEEQRREGYFVLLLKSIEAHLRAWNVNLLTAPVDPEMAPIWSEKLGFTILSDEEKNSMLESHPLVMFENLTLVQKSLA